MNAFLFERDGQTFQSVPVAAFLTRKFEYLYHYTDQLAKETTHGDA